MIVCSLYSGITIETGKSSNFASSRPIGFGFSSITPPPTRCNSFLVEGGRRFQLAFAAVLFGRKPLPSPTKPLFKVGRRTIAQFSRRLGNIAPSRMHLAAAGRLISNLEIEASGRPERRNQLLQGGRLAGPQLIRPRQIAMER